MITPKRYSVCSKCKKQVTCFRSYENPLVCWYCPGFQGTKGGGSLVPCESCVEPEIHWYKQETYGEIAKCCEKCNNKKEDENICLSDMF